MHIQVKSPDPGHHICGVAATDVGISAPRLVGSSPLQCLNLIVGVGGGCRSSSISMKSGSQMWLASLREIVGSPGTALADSRLMKLTGLVSGFCVNPTPRALELHGGLKVQSIDIRVIF